MPQEIAEIYTDGSCHTQRRTGAWVAIVFAGTKKKVLSAIVPDTTHNRMELVAVIKGIEYIRNNYPAITTFKLFSDSQYVVSLPGRKEKLSALGFSAKKGNAIQNSDLVKTLLELLSSLSIEFIKIKAHQKQGDTINYNREADKLSRKLLRKAVEESAV